MQIPIEVGQPVVNITVQLAPGDSLGVDAKEAAAGAGLPVLHNRQGGEVPHPGFVCMVPDTSANGDGIKTRRSE